MNIQITNIPNGQKIKSIDFKITFDDSGEIASTIQSIKPFEKQEPTHKPYTSTSIALCDTKGQSEEQTTPTIPDIDISNREAKIPEEMLEESF